jgi:hypothetical protein
MKRSTDPNEDLIREYLNPETIEKAPDGLSQKIIFRIQAQEKIAPVRQTLWKKYSVLFVSGSITLIFIILSLILPRAGEDTFILPAINSLISYSDLIQKFSMDLFSGLRIPALLKYLALVIFMLTLLDFVLDFVFHRKHGMGN